MRAVVILSVYNGSSFLHQQLDSLLNQTYPDFYVLIRDDGSTDSSLSIICDYALKYPHRFFVSVSLPSINIGVNRSFQALLSEANADLYFFSDQDDIWFSHKIEIFVSTFLQFDNFQSRCLAIICDSIIYPGSKQSFFGIVSLEQYLSSSESPVKYRRRLSDLYRNKIQGCALCINAPLATRVSQFPSSPQLYDWHIFIFAILYDCLWLIPKPLQIYRQHPGNYVGAYNPSETFARRLIRVLRATSYLYFFLIKLFFNTLVRLSTDR